MKVKPRIAVIAGPANAHGDVPQAVTSSPMNQTPTSSCPSRTDVEALVAGRLSTERHQAVERHVRGCRKCQAELAAIGDRGGDLLNLLRLLLQDEPPVDLRP